MVLYAQDGVDVYEGDDFSAFAGEICRASYGNSLFVRVHDLSKGHFRGPRGFTLMNLPEGTYMDLAPDGIGTKTIAIDAASAHSKASYDLVAMCFGDITRWGGLPLLFVNVLEVSTLGKTGTEATEREYQTNLKFRTMMRGLAELATLDGFVIYKGETAEVGVCVGSENPDASTKFNWSGTAFGVYHPDLMITGDTLAEGQTVIALRENGFRSNGISSVRKALAIKFGPEWYKNPDAQQAITAAAQPSVLYDLFLTRANGWLEPNDRIKAHLIVHVTGGAIKSKLGCDILFPRGLSAQLDDLWEPPEIMRQCAEWRGLSDEECYETWNGGQGALVVVDESDAGQFVDAAYAYRVEAKVCGRIIRSAERERIVINSKFSGKTIVFAKP